MKRLLALLLASATFLSLGGSVFAHIVVKPGDALTSSFQTFSMSVPNEKDSPVVDVKLLIPDSLQFVAPTVKTGWTIKVEKEGAGEEAKVKSITWSAGSIPADFRDDFTFSAKTPDNAGDLQWKAFQTYQDGTTVSWDKDPSSVMGDNDAAPSGPFSVTKVAADTADATPARKEKNDSNFALPLGITALALSIVALGVATRKK
jgi:uncharacterized protein YcnI